MRARTNSGRGSPQILQLPWRSPPHGPPTSASSYSSHASFLTGRSPLATLPARSCWPRTNRSIHNAFKKVPEQVFSIVLLRIGKIQFFAHRCAVAIFVSKRLDQQLGRKQSTKISFRRGLRRLRAWREHADSRAPPRGARCAAVAGARLQTNGRKQWRSRMDLKREAVGAPAPAASHSLDPTSAARPRFSRPFWRARGAIRAGRQRAGQVERRRCQPRSPRPRHERCSSTWPTSLSSATTSPSSTAPAPSSSSTKARWRSPRAMPPSSSARPTPSGCPALQIILKQLEDRGIPHFLFLNKIDESEIPLRELIPVLQPASTQAAGAAPDPHLGERRRHGLRRPRLGARLRLPHACALRDRRASRRRIRARERGALPHAGAARRLRRRADGAIALRHAARRATRSSRT